MEQLKPKHNHKLTDLIKIFIFALVLLMPFLAWLPNAIYYGFNKYAQVGTEETYYNLYQYVINGKPNYNYDLDDVSDWNYEECQCEGITQDKFLVIRATSDDASCVLNPESTLEYTATQQNPAKIYLSLVAYADNDISCEIDNGYIFDFEVNDEITKHSEIFICEYDDSFTFAISFYMADQRDSFFIKECQLFNLTQIFGSGNEPTKAEFESMLTQDYYNYGNNYVIKDKGTNITWSMYNSWEDVWQTPLFSWTNESILNTGLMAFVGVFGITNTAYISNLLTYELVIVTIYIVIDIVLAMFTALTHLLHKE